MREIGFRAWDIEEKCWIPREQLAVAALDGQKDIMTYEQEDDKWCAETIPFALMEYIGQRDMHGQMIFEGDICRYNHAASNNSLPRRYQGVVCWQEDKAKFVIDCEPQYDIIWSVIEVVGNIYDTPELLAK